MKGKELVIKTLLGEDLEEVPIGVHSAWPAAERSPYSIGECCVGGEKMAEAQIDFQNRHKMDVIHLEIGVGPLVEAMGATVSWPEDRPPIVRENPIDSLEDIDDLEIPDPYEDGKLPELLETTKLVKQELGGEAFIIGEADQGPFNLAAQVIGIEQMLFKIARREDLELIDELLRITMEAVSRLAQAQIESGADATCVGESYASPDMISPDFYRDFVMPAHKILNRKFTKKNLDWALHICGDVTKILEYLNEVNPTILEIDYKTDLSAIRNKVDESTVLGTVDPRTFLCQEEKNMEEEVRENVNLLKPGGRFILHSGCSLPSNTSDNMIKNFRNFARTV